MINQVRIIGGRWRSRKLSFPDIPDIRPTPDRVRETLFNWLQPYISGANCLDLFAGSGALGFEALSRGAGHVIMIEQSSKITDALQKNAEKLNAQDAIIYQYSFQACEEDQHYLKNLLKKHQLNKFDIVFLDPPYQSNLLSLSLNALLRGNLLKEKALVYLEWNQPFNILNEQLTRLKSKKAGDVYYYLFEVAERPD